MKLHVIMRLVVAGQAVYVVILYCQVVGNVGSLEFSCSSKLILYFVDRAPGIILVNNQLDALFSMYLCISLLYMFRATQCSSSGESIVSIHYLV